MKKRFIFLALSSTSSLFYGHGMDWNGDPVPPIVRTEPNQVQQEPVIRTEEEIKKCEEKLEKLSRMIRIGAYPLASQILNDNEELFSSFNESDYEKGVLKEKWNQLTNAVLAAPKGLIESNKECDRFYFFRMLPKFFNVSYRKEALEIYENKKIEQFLGRACNLSKMIPSALNYSEGHNPLLPPELSLVERLLLVEHLNLNELTKLSPGQTASWIIWSTQVSTNPLNTHKVLQSFLLTKIDDPEVNDDLRVELNKLYLNTIVDFNLIDPKDRMILIKYLEFLQKENNLQRTSDEDKIALMMWICDTEQEKQYPNFIQGFTELVKKNDDLRSNFLGEYFRKHVNDEKPMKRFFDNFGSLLIQENLIKKTQKKDYLKDDAEILNCLIEFEKKCDWREFYETPKVLKALISTLEERRGPNPFFQKIYPYSNFIREYYIESLKWNIESFSGSFRRTANYSCVFQNQAISQLFSLTSFIMMITFDNEEIKLPNPGNAKHPFLTEKWIKNFVEICEKYGCTVSQEKNLKIINIINDIEKGFRYNISFDEWTSLVFYIGEIWTKTQFRKDCDSEYGYGVNKMCNHIQELLFAVKNLQEVYNTPHIDLSKEEVKEEKLPPKKKKKKQQETEEERNVRIQKEQEERDRMEKERVLERTNNRITSYENLIAKEEAYTKALVEKRDALSVLLARKSISESEKKRFFRDFQGLKWNSFDQYEKKDTLKHLESIEKAEEVLGKVYEVYNNAHTQRVNLEKTIEFSINKLKTANNHVIPIEEPKPQEPWAVDCELAIRERTDLMVCGLMEQYEDIMSTLEKNGIALRGEKRIVGDLYSYYSETFTADVLGKKVVAIHFCGAQRYQYTTRIYFEVVDDKKLSYLGVGHYDNPTGKIVKTW